MSLPRRKKRPCGKTTRAKSHLHTEQKDVGPTFEATRVRAAPPMREGPQIAILMSRSLRSSSHVPAESPPDAISKERTTPRASRDLAHASLSLCPAFRGPPQERITSKRACPKLLAPTPALYAREAGEPTTMIGCCVVHPACWPHARKLKQIVCRRMPDGGCHRGSTEQTSSMAI